MKPLIALLTWTLMSCTCFSQSWTPQISISNDDTLFCFDQAQSKRIAATIIQANTLDSICMFQSTIIQQMDSLCLAQDSMIYHLHRQKDNLVLINESYQDGISHLENVVDKQNNRIKTLKKQRWWSGVIVAVLTTLTIIK